jgi:phenylalanyl-tRNA synthetase beta chain
MRQSLLFSGLEVLAYNINRRQKDLKLFEFGTVYFKNQEGYREETRLALFLTGDRAAESWKDPSKPVAFPDLYTVVELILEKLGADQVEVEIIHTAPFDYALRLMLGTKELGTIGVVQDAYADKNG